MEITSQAAQAEIPIGVLKVEYLRTDKTFDFCIEMRVPTFEHMEAVLLENLSVLAAMLKKGTGATVEIIPDKAVAKISIRSSIDANNKMILPALFALQSYMTKPAVHRWKSEKRGENEKIIG